MENAIVQVYTGNGKGKTTAATGLIVRALGQGFKVLLVRFLKTAAANSGELAILDRLPGLDVVSSTLGGIAAKQRQEDLVADVQAVFQQVHPLVMGGYYDLVVLDEFNSVLAKGYLPVAQGVDFCRQRPRTTELVLTGRRAPDEICELADLVTVMQAEKHPYADGLPARAGIEF